MNIEDQIGNPLQFNQRPERIVSLVPSMTELIADLGYFDQLVGRTKFCVHPEDKIKSITKIGGTKNPRVEEIIQLKPDLILANKEENDKSDIAKLQQHCPVYVSNVKTLQDNYEMISQLGQILHCTEKAHFEQKYA